MRTALAAIVLLVAVLAVAGPAEATDGRGLFVDDDGSVHESDINGIGAAGISRGCNPPANDRFCPSQTLTRAQLASFLVRALDIPSSGENRFDDTSGSVHAADIRAIAAAGITLGCNPPANDRFCPDQPVTRAQLASFLVRALDIPSSGENRFDDTSGSVHAADIRAIAAAGITLGCNPPANDRFCPDQPVTRAQLASFLVRALDLPATTGGRLVDITGNVHAADIRAIAAAGITRGCNPPANDRYCPRDAVTRAQMASFLLRAVSGVEPIPNHLSVRAGLVCAKNSMTCTKRINLRRGVDLSIREGWYHVLPYLPGESAAFTGGSTRVTFSWNGTAIAPAYIGLSESDGMANRHWQIRPPSVRPGVNTLRVVWQWEGEITQTATVTITGT